MCEQTEINYLDGDIVWVKLGSCWWPGQVTGFENLPEDIQHEFKKKPLIAAVKFFQEDTYEFVKNYQQIYKYNCTLKDEFIRKGLDKYRSKIKDGATYMSKFPGDVEMAEKLTGGDPDILNSDKFSPEEKPDISALFGDKKIPKKKKEREDFHKRNDGTDIVRRITHPRFLKESDHEVRIRHQPSSSPSTPTSTSSPQYPCHLCNFTSSRVNVIICHIKSHRSGNSPMARSKVKTYSQSRSRVSDSETPKRKYVRREKSQHKNKTDNGAETGKRKYNKQTEKANKKKKSDPELREKLLADWDDESDEDISFDKSKSLDVSVMSTSSTKDQSSIDTDDEVKKDRADITDSSEILAETEKLLKETEKLTNIHMDKEELISNLHNSESDINERKSDSENDIRSPTNESFNKIHKEKDLTLESDNKHVLEKSDKKSRLSCFDFDEDDVPEPSIPPVRKIPRVFGEKNLSLKKEMIKEFEMSQALKNPESQKEPDNDKAMITAEDIVEKKNSKGSEIPTKEQDDLDVPDIKETNEKAIVLDTEDENKISKMNDKSENDAISQTDRSDKRKTETNVAVGDVEIVEIFEVDKEETKGTLKRRDSEKVMDETELNDIIGIKKYNNDTFKKADETLMDNKSTIDSTSPVKDTLNQSMEEVNSKQMDETLSERFTTETEDETVSESAETLPENSENSDVEQKLVRSVKKKKGRPRKSLEPVNITPSDNSRKRLRSNRTSRDKSDRFDVEKTSESDTDRSSSGRKRKPNKKYLESDIITKDSEKTFLKTDDSQSEGDDVFPEKSKNKLRRGRRSIALHSNEQMKQKLELSEQILKGGESKTSIPINTIEEKSDKNEDTERERSIETEMQTVTDQTMDITSRVTLSKDIDMESNIEQLDKPLPSESVSVLETEKVTVDPIDKKSELLSADNQHEETELSLTKSNTDDEVLKDTSDSTLTVTDSPLTNTINLQEPDISKGAVEILPPKKSQIKKFELSQLDLPLDPITDSQGRDCDLETGEQSKKPAELEDNTDAKPSDITKQSVDASITDISTMESTSAKELDADLKMESNVITEETEVTENKESQLTDNVKAQNVEKCVEQEKIKLAEKEEIPITSENTEQIFQDSATISSELNATNKLIQSKHKSIPEINVKSKKEILEEKPVNTFQEAFLKTLQIDKRKETTDDMDLITAKGKKSKKVTKMRKSDDCNNVNTILLNVQNSTTEGAEKNKDITENIITIPAQDILSDSSIMTDFQGVEIIVQDTTEPEKKIDEPVLENTSQLTSSSSDYSLIVQQQTQSTGVEEPMKTTNLDTQKLEESPKIEIPSPSPTCETNIPVKKREMPRIIENVTLTEPMQILKTKLLDKMPSKGVKHKLEADVTKKNEPKGSPKPKVMRMESLSSNSKIRTGLKVTSPHLSLTKKLQVLKAEEAENAAALEVHNEKTNVQTTQTVTVIPSTETYIQQSSQSLADMDLDINSMPFVLSDDVLTPESIEQMPVVISSIIPASSTAVSTLSLTPTTQVVASNPGQFKITGETTPEVSPTKKKSGTPTILKNKYKAKPTITSIKTIVPPLTGGVKGLKFQSSQGNKSPQLLAQKTTSGKYVVVQTSGSQQTRYSVQGKTGSQQKIAIPGGKGTSNAQVVQQGNKVVILTSAQSGQAKMLPLNIPKTLSGKVQRIMTNKNQVLCPISPQGVITSKTVIAPKGDGSSATTSKLSTGHKLISTQGIITSKGVIAPLSGTITKTALLGTLSQGILTKGGIYTPISAAALGGKTIIGSKTLVAKGTTIITPQNLGNQKAILTPISQTIGGKTILSAQSIINPKGTVLTPITGQQVKAIAAKSPSKVNKVQYQSVQQKVQLPTLQKTQKVPISSTSQQGRGSLVSKSPSSSTLVFQNIPTNSKGTSAGKKTNKQMSMQQGTSVQNLLSQSNSQQTAVVTQIQAKAKTVPVPNVQKVIIPRGSRQSKNQQKIMVQKVQEPITTQAMQMKQTIVNPSVTSINVPKTTIQHKVTTVSTATPKSVTKSHLTNKMSQKNLLNMAMNSVSGTTVSTNVSTTPLSLPSLEPIEPEKKVKMENTLDEKVQKEEAKMEKVHIEKSTEMEKIEEPKVAPQPQIMALPTESSDGTQTYVLVTIDEQGQIQPLDNNALMSLEGTTQNPDGTRTLYIDPSSLGEAGTLDNIVLQFDNGVLPDVQTNTNEASQVIISESFPASEIIQTSNQDILAAALANTDFQQEINLTENPSANVMTTSLTQTSLINQTILQSTIIPPTEPISSPSVLETSLTLNQPIMTPLEVPSNLPIQSESTATSVVSTIPSSLELPITITNPNISYISTGETQIQIPGNSMPDIGEIMEGSASTEIVRTDIPSSTQYLVIPNLDENIAVKAQDPQNGATVSYAVTLPCNIVLETSHVQTTPSMPIINDSFPENSQFTNTIQTTIGTEANFVDVPVSEMLVSKPSVISPKPVQTQDVTATSEIIISSHETPACQNSIASTSGTQVIKEVENTSIVMAEVYSSQEVPVSSQELILKQNVKDTTVTAQDKVTDNENIMNTQLVEQSVKPMTSSMPIIDDGSLMQSEPNVKVQPVEQMSFEVTDSHQMEAASSQEAEAVNKFKHLPFKEDSNIKAVSPSTEGEAATSNQSEVIPEETIQTLPVQSLNVNQENMEVDAIVESQIYISKTNKPLEECQTDEPSSQDESNESRAQTDMKLSFEEAAAQETTQETPSQSFEQFNISMTNNSVDLPSQSASKSENSGEPSQSATYEPMETDEETVTTEPPTQSFEHAKTNEASQSYETSREANTNAPTQSYNELMQNNDERIERITDETIDDPSFPTQSYEVGKVENISDNLETDAEISQEGNIPSQSNDIGTDGIGTSSVSTNNSGLNEDETASSSYVPETPENQERDQDQESAISTSSYEIPPCEELNIASSSVIPDTSVRTEHTSIHDNGVPEIPTSSYNLNPDITSTHVDSVPTSSYEDQVIVEQNVSTSYEVPMSMPGLEENSSQNFVTESTDHRNEPSSYYAHHQEVTASYYESVDQEANPRLEEDPQEEVTPSYYEGNPQVASQSYFPPEEATPSYSSRNVSPGYYERPESEASQSYYPADDLEKTEQSSSQNIEASQSFYQEQSDELRLRQQGEATPTYSERYPVDYTLENSPIERHDLVESSVPATKPMER